MNITRTQPVTDYGWEYLSQKAIYEGYTESGLKHLRYVDGIATASDGGSQVRRDIFEKRLGTSNLSDARWALLAHMWLKGIILDHEVDQTIERLQVGDKGK